MHMQHLWMSGQVHGVGAALVVTPTTRVAGSVSQTITTVDTTTTVQEV